MSYFPFVYPTGQYSPNYVQVFEPEFRLRYQAQRKLMAMVRYREFKGTTYNIPYIDKLIMTPATALGADIPAVAINASEINLTVSPFQLKTYVAQFDQDALNAEAVGPQAEDHALAYGRMQDQFIIDGMNGGTTNTIAPGGTGMTVQKILQAQAILGRNEVPEENRFLLMHVNDWAMFNQQAQFTNSLYADRTPLAQQFPSNGYKGNYLGFNIYVIGDRAEGGLPYNPSTQVRTCFAWHMDAVYAGFNQIPYTTVTDVPQNARIEILSIMSGGAVVGDARGTVAINCDESSLGF